MFTPEDFPTVAILINNNKKMNHHKLETYIKLHERLGVLWGF